jgi:hypothetical protein
MLKSFLFIYVIVFSIQVSAQTGIGTNAPNASAKLEVASTDKGLLIPRMTESQRDLIASPANGLLIYQTSGVAGFYVNTGSSSAKSWTRVNMDWTRTGNDIAYTSGNVSTTGALTGGNTATSKLSGFVSNLAEVTNGRDLSVSDNGNILRVSATSDITLNLPASGIPEGFNCMVLQGNTGQVTFSGTFYNRNSFTKTAGRYSIVTILFAGGVYIVSGEMSN